MSTETVEFIIRDCGTAGFLPIIRVLNGKLEGPWARELYRGEHRKPADPREEYRQTARLKAWYALTEAWDDETTDNIKEFKNPPTCLEGCP